MTTFLETQAGLVGIFHCSVVSEPLATLVLSHGGLTLASSSGENNLNPRFSMSSAPNSLRLEIRDLQPADSGDYACAATNSLGSATSSLHFHANGNVGTHCREDQWRVSKERPNSQARSHGRSGLV